ncbi:hypothetical protein JANAI62_37260 [Jannaschia pagri]|uniref:Response regulatory domain-containing protein n=1 Tax=Jannaschia pagri TaxID=2829797 RepID=A0ABQ4NRS0_9RHOB|nr:MULTISPECIES: response regulator [unclassified Jannaschia]GIT93230.1 hypothetical protein JANAI61_36880 [Jannaschia sp. AI_61]GIT97103.1 hypothetical protein JANAI62_37260 [Jannaschia sp. AI_62]
MALTRILVVDDALTDRMKLTLALKSRGFEVTGCASGAEALEAVQSAAYDLVMLDLVMPEMDGSAVLEALRSDAATDAIPVIIVSSTDDPDELARVLALGAIAHLSKPFTPESLGEVLSRV